MAAEYTSAAVAAQVLVWMIQRGLPPELLNVATRVVRDELDHARLSHEVLVALGGEDTPVDLPAEHLQISGELPEVLVRNFCLGESFAVPYFAAMRAGTTNPAVRPVLDRILEDEAVHRAFGWQVLAALVALDPELRPRLESQLPALLADFRGYADPPPAPLLSSDERAAGLLDHDEYRRLYAETWHDDLRPRFERLGITAP